MVNEVLRDVVQFDGRSYSRTINGCAPAHRPARFAARTPVTMRISVPADAKGITPP
jgi:hypothetical protein